KPALAGTTTEPDSHDQVTKYGCPTRPLAARRFKFLLRTPSARTLSTSRTSWASSVYRMGRSARRTRITRSHLWLRIVAISRKWSESTYTPPSPRDPTPFRSKCVGHLVLRRATLHRVWTRVSRR